MSSVFWLLLVVVSILFDVDDVGVVVDDDELFELDDVSLFFDDEVARNLLNTHLMELDKPSPIVERYRRIIGIPNKA
jgi:hypothetical protein